MSIHGVECGRDTSEFVGANSSPSRFSRESRGTIKWGTFIKVPPHDGSTTLVRGCKQI